MVLNTKDPIKVSRMGNADSANTVCAGVITQWEQVVRLWKDADWGGTEMEQGLIHKTSVMGGSDPA